METSCATLLRLYKCAMPDMSCKCRNARSFKFANTTHTQKIDLHTANCCSTQDQAYNCNTGCAHNNKTNKTLHASITQTITKTHKQQARQHTLSQKQHSARVHTLSAIQIMGTYLRVLERAEHVLALLERAEHVLALLERAEHVLALLAPKTWHAQTSSFHKALSKHNMLCASAQCLQHVSVLDY